METIGNSLVWLWILNYLPPLNADPFAAPNVDEATNMGITQAITPYKRSAKVWKKYYAFLISKVKLTVHTTRELFKIQAEPKFLHVAQS